MVSNSSLSQHTCNSPPYLDRPNNGSQQRLQTFKEYPAQGPIKQPIKGWTVAGKVFDNFYILLVLVFSAIVRLESVLDPC